MHFRFRGNNIQVVKSLPDPITGKSRSIPVGSINTVNLRITEKLRDNCTPSELQEIEAWVQRYQSVAHLKNKHAALTLPEQMAAAALWFEQAHAEEAREGAENVLAAITELRRVLHKRDLL